MKGILKTTSIIILFLFCSCEKKDDENTTLTPLEQLPPKTQIGANTAGCLVNGEAFLRKGSGFTLNFFYQNQLNFGLGYVNKENNTNRAITVASLNETLEVNKIYILSDYGNNKDSKYATYSIGSKSGPRKDYFETTENINGELIITYHNFEKAIISGEFWFDAIESEGRIVRVREGRFDFKY